MSIHSKETLGEETYINYIPLANVPRGTTEAELNDIRETLTEPVDHCEYQPDPADVPRGTISVSIEADYCWSVGV